MQSVWVDHIFGSTICDVTRLLAASITATCLMTVVACRGRAAVDPAAKDAAVATTETEQWRVMHEESYRKNWATM